MVSAVSIWMGDRLLDFVGDPANAIHLVPNYCGMGDNISSSPDPGVQGMVSRVVLHRLRPRVYCVQLVTLGGSQE